MMEDKLKVLKDLENKAREVWITIERKVRFLEDEPQARALVGKYFKFKDCSPKSQCWRYVKINKHVVDTLFCDFFEENDQGNIHFCYNEPYHYLRFGGAQPLLSSKEEYIKIQKALLKKLNKKLKKLEAK